MFELFQAEFKRIWIEFIRYPIDAISGIIANAVVFYGLFLSANYIAGVSNLNTSEQINVGERLDVIVIGYVLWILVVFIVGGIAFGIQVEAQTGTLEQIFLSPFGTLTVLLIRGIASLTLNITFILGILIFTMLLTKRYLHFSPAIILPLFTVLLGAYGLSLIIAALTLLYKRVQQLLGLVQFGLFFLLTFPSEVWGKSLLNLRAMLPMAVGSDVLRDLMGRNENLDLSSFIFALMNGLGYLIVGMLVFRWAESKAKRQALLNGY
ncbi:ABC transporter ATP-binding protein [Dulcicalothrix desertica PCC 7102]|uniref:ABC transporter ATP-binding protein n=1 Tax=Dulcicalothrix desertica PCC 7102 TaxID=232991 RepID=A0A433UMF5_9CYAN|nr:ABC transporter permease [Dulcicalothrix desertica]RUS95010.1 ABC transporter ATP-binding protein [Dulcicalothrix desertica PCC 7102]TWH51414.1 ABC-2 type transport system permease protein [Dulcicalothrix desertica PCC 7102]